MVHHEIPKAAHDPLTELLRDLRMSGVFYCQCELSQPWGLEMPVMDGSIWFHAVIEGRVEWAANAFSGADNGAYGHVLRAGDFMLMPHGRGHVIRSDPGAATPNVLTLPHEGALERHARLIHGGGGDECRLVCGVVRFDDSHVRDLLHHLPAVLRIPGEGGRLAPWMRGLLDVVVHEGRQPSLGAEVVVAKVADILVIQSIRAWLRDDPAAQAGWFAAARDKHVGRAIAVMHRQLDRAWTVDTLASQAALSRSAFAERFLAIAAATPMDYLTQLRMTRARDLLTQLDPPKLADLAARVGYQSEAAFSRAFKRHVGVAPGTFSRRGDSEGDGGS